MNTLVTINTSFIDVGTKCRNWRLCRFHLISSCAGNVLVNICNVKIPPVTWLEGTEEVVEVYLHSFLTSALDGVGIQRHVALFSGRSFGIRCTRGWVGPRDGLDRPGEKFLAFTGVRIPNRPGRSETLFRPPINTCSKFKKPEFVMASYVVMFVLKFIEVRPGVLEVTDMISICTFFGCVSCHEEKRTACFRLRVSCSLQY
jgi:hypothetical protein